MTKKYEGLKKTANKRLALQVTSLTLATTLAFALTGCTETKTTPTVTPAPGIVTPSPRPTEKPVETPSPFVLEDLTKESIAKDINMIDMLTIPNEFRIREMDAVSFLLYQNIFNIKSKDLNDIVEYYLEGQFDISEISDNADGLASQFITQNLLNPVSKHMSFNFNHDELDYLMYQEVENQYLAIRTMFEDEKIDVEKRNQAFNEWLTKLEKFYNEDGIINLSSDTIYGGSYYRSSMSASAEATVEYLGIEMAMWVKNVANKALSEQFDAIKGKDNVRTNEIKKALNKITNSSNPMARLVLYLETNSLTKEEVEQLKVMTQLYNSHALAESILAQCDFTDVQPSILAKGQECEEVAKVKVK